MTAKPAAASERCAEGTAAGSIPPLTTNSSAMPISSALARQALVDGGFDEQLSEACGVGPGSTFRHRELPPPWSITAPLEAGEAVAHIDVFLQFGEQQVGNIHRVPSYAALVSNLPAIVSGLTALVGSLALMCPRCGEGWITVREPEHSGTETAFFACTESCEPGSVLSNIQPIVTY